MTRKEGGSEGLCGAINLNGVFSMSCSYLSEFNCLQLIKGYGSN